MVRSDCTLVVLAKTNNAFNQGLTYIVVLCYHAEIIASGLGRPDPILLHCTHQNTRHELNRRTDKVSWFQYFSPLRKRTKMGQVKIEQHVAALSKDGENFLPIPNYYLIGRVTAHSV